MKKIVYSILLLCSTVSMEAKVILWDLGGVLFEPDKFGVAFEVGMSRFISHAVWDCRSPNIQGVLFDVLRQLDSPFDTDTQVAGSAHGMPLPAIMCKWQAGTITGKEINRRAQKLIRQLYAYDYFDSKSHRELISRCVRTMFNPAVLARNVYPVKEGLALLKESSKLRNKDGTKKHRQFVFSNWDHLSFDTVRKKYPYIFTQFEEIVISGHIKLIKPHKDAFDYLLNTYNLDPRECVLIDDQKSNVDAARKCGMKAVLIRNRDYKALRQALKKLDVL